MRCSSGSIFFDSSSLLSIRRLEAKTAFSAFCCARHRFLKCPMSAKCTSRQCLGCATTASRYKAYVLVMAPPAPSSITLGQFRAFNYAMRWSRVLWLLVAPLAVSAESTLPGHEGFLPASIISLVCINLADGNSWQDRGSVSWSSILTIFPNISILVTVNFLSTSPETPSRRRCRHEEGTSPANLMMGPNNMRQTFA